MAAAPIMVWISLANLGVSVVVVLDWEVRVREKRGGIWIRVSIEGGKVPWMV